jgi:hypothetical protein
VPQWLNSFVDVLRVDVGKDAGTTKKKILEIKSSIFLPVFQFGNSLFGLLCAQWGVSRPFLTPASI